MPIILFLGGYGLNYMPHWELVKKYDIVDFELGTKITEGEMGDSKMGLHARLMSQALRKLKFLYSNTQHVVLQAKWLLKDLKICLTIQ